MKLELVCRATELDGSKRILFDIRDHGCGVPDSELNRMLQPFTRLDLARGQANGSGLGLAIVERIVKRHSGKIHIRNHEAGGLQISIYLPPAK